MKLKRIFTVVLLVLCCSMLTGCSDPFKSIENWWKGIQSENQDDAVRDNLTEVSTNTVSKSTKEAADKLADAQSKKDTQSHGWNVFKAIRSDNYCMPWNKNKQQEKLSAKVDRADKDLTTKLSYDTVYQNSKDSSKEKEKKDIAGMLKKMLPLLIVVALLIGALVIATIIKRPKAAPKPIPMAEKPVLEDARHTEQLKVDYNKLLKANCKKAELDYDEVLQCHGGDARKAYESLNYMLGNNLSKEVMLNKMKGM